MRTLRNWGINIVGVLQRFNLSWNEVETFREGGGYFVVDVKEGNELPKDLDWIKFRYWNGILLEIEESYRIVIIITILYDFKLDT